MTFRLMPEAELVMRINCIYAVEHKCGVFNEAVPNGVKTASEVVHYCIIGLHTRAVLYGKYGRIRTAAMSFPTGPSSGP